jgi:HAMP domain-containing protein
MDTFRPDLRYAVRSFRESSAFQDQMVAPVRPALMALAVAVGAVLLIACLNVANLLLARTTERRRETAVRLALGAGRGRLARQLLTESLLLALAGGIAGIVFAFGGLQLLQALARSLARTDSTSGVSIPRLDEVRIDLSALAFMLIVAVMSALLFGLAPAVHESNSRHTDIREGASSAPAGVNLLHCAMNESVTTNRTGRRAQVDPEQCRSAITAIWRPDCLNRSRLSAGNGLQCLHGVPASARSHSCFASLQFDLRAVSRCPIFHACC